VTAAKVYEVLDRFFLLSCNMERPTLESMMIGKPTSPATPAPTSVDSLIHVMVFDQTICLKNYLNRQILPVLAVNSKL
jgi:hypothetical protein